MSKVKFSIITKGNWSSGFRLAGVDVLQVTDLHEARQVLQPLVERNEPALIAIEEDLYPKADKKFQKHLEEKPFPVILPLPKLEIQKMGEQEKYVSELVRSCIGYYVKLK